MESTKPREPSDPHLVYQAEMLPVWLGTIPTLIVLAAYLLSLVIPPNNVFEMRRVQLVIDGACAYIALNLALILALSNRYERDIRVSRYGFAAAALFSIGILKFISAATDDPQTFLWLHSISRLASAVFFSLAWYPRTQYDGDSAWRRVSIFAAAVSFVVGILVVTYSAKLPPPSIGIEFTFLFKAANVAAALLFLFAIVQGLRHLDLNQRNYDASLLSICIFYAASCLLIPFTYLWGPRWWLVQILELFPFVLVFAYKFYAYRLLQDELMSTKNALQQSNESLEQFAYLASHDMQEPLRTVASYLRLLAKRNQEKLDLSSREFMAFSMDAIERMQAYIRDLLQYSRLNAQNSLSLEATSVTEIVKEAEKNLQRAVQESAAEISLGPLPGVKIRKNYIVLLFQNLISNAIKYRGSLPPKIEVSAIRRGGFWIFSVRDNGLGFEEEVKFKIFEMFERAHGKHDHPGTGIGLSACKKIVTGWGGKIWAESKVNRGSTFSFTVPARLVVISTSP